MRSILVFSIIISIIFLTDLPSGDADCYEAWSRCTGWSSGGTGILWKTCAGRCRLCAGRASGNIHIRRFNRIKTFLLPTWNI